MSSLWDIVKTVGTGIISNVVPGGAAIMGVVNELLPDDMKLPVNATGAQVQSAIQGLPPDLRAKVMDKEFEVDLAQIKESYASNRAMLNAEAISPHTTRPYIAKHSFHVVGFTCVVTVILWSYGIIKGDKDMVETVVDGWPFLLAAIGPLVVLLHAYFGVLRQEQKNKLDAAGGVAQPSGIGGIISALVNRNGK